MLLIILLPYYLALNFEVPSFVTHYYITKGLLNIKLDKRIISISVIVKTVKLFNEHPSK